MYSILYVSILYYWTLGTVADSAALLDSPFDNHNNNNNNNDNDNDNDKENDNKLFFAKPSLGGGDGSAGARKLGLVTEPLEGLGYRGLAQRLGRLCSRGDRLRRNLTIIYTYRPLHGHYTFSCIRYTHA